MRPVSEPRRYRDFLAFVFDRPEAEPHTSEAWYFDGFDEDFTADAAETVELYRHAFENCGTDLAPFSDGQITLGLNYLFNNSCGSLIFALASEEVPMPSRVAAVHSMKHLYSDCFDRRCAPVLGHIDEKGGNALNGICYMLWDVTPLGWWSDGDNERMAPMADAIFSVLQHGLSSRNDASVESVLHGLGHFKHRYPREVEGLIDRFLAKRKDVRNELRRYAEAARTGCIL